MKRMKIPVLAAATAVLVSGIGAAPASTVPTVAAKSVAEAAKPTTYPYVQQIRDGWRNGFSRRGFRGHHRGRNWAPWIAAPFVGYGLGYALGGGDYYGYGYDYDDGPGYYDYADGSAGGYARCEATFRSFDPDSGTYMGFDGIRHRCPYL